MNLITKPDPNPQARIGPLLLKSPRGGGSGDPHGCLEEKNKSRAKGWGARLTVGCAVMACRRLWGMYIVVSPPKHTEIHAFSKTGTTFQAYPREEDLPCPLFRTAGGMRVWSLWSATATKGRFSRRCRTGRSPAAVLRENIIADTKHRAVWLCRWSFFFNQIRSLWITIRLIWF